MTTGRHALLIFLVALLWLAATGGLWTSIPIYGDAAIFIEYAVRVADGQVPHVDFYEVKPTGFVFAAWPFLQVGRWFGVPDWMAVRFCSLSMLAALSAAMFCAVRGFLLPTLKESRAVSAGWIAGIAILALRGLPEAAAAGLQPKVFTLLCPISAFALLFARKPMLAGAVAAFAPFHWQPGAIAWLLPLFLAYRRPSSERALLRFVIGSAITVGLYATYLLATGSFGAFLDQALFGAFGAVGGEERGASLRLMRILHMLWVTAGWELLIAAPLLLMLLWRGRLELWPIAALILIFGAWSLLDFQGTPDLIVLTIPMVALAGAQCGSMLGRRATAAVAGTLLLASLLPHTIEGDLTLARQQEVAASYLDAVGGSEAPILAIGDVFLPLLAERPSLGTELFGYGLIARLQSGHPGGAAGWVDARLAEAPAGVVIGRGLGEELTALLRARMDEQQWRLLDTVKRTKDVNGLVVETEVWVRQP